MGRREPLAEIIQIETEALRDLSQVEAQVRPEESAFLRAQKQAGAPDLGGHLLVEWLVGPALGTLLGVHLPITKQGTTPPTIQDVEALGIKVRIVVKKRLVAGVAR